MADDITLTPEQEAKIPDYIRKWIRRCTQAEFKPDDAREAVLASYKAADLKMPKVTFIAEDPAVVAGILEVVSRSLDTDLPKPKTKLPARPKNVDENLENLIADAIVDGFSHHVFEDDKPLRITTAQKASLEYQTRKTIRGLEKGTKFLWTPPHDGANWCGWRGFYDFAKNELGYTNKLGDYLKLDDAGAFWYWLFDEIAVLLAPPKLFFDRGKEDGSEQYRFHRADGPAIEWPLVKIYYYKGVNIPGDIIDTPEKITHDRVDKESNAEIRRVMVEKYPGGEGKYLEDSGAQEIQRDDWGILYRKELRDDEPIVMVKVVNSTEEPDGTIRTFYIRVPPQTRTAKEAVAWTFEKKASDYAPDIET